MLVPTDTKEIIMADHGAVTWFQIGTDDEDTTKQFYGELFG